MAEDDDIRQGDIYFTKVERIDSDFTEESKNNIVARGEATGHKHKLKLGTLLIKEKTAPKRDYDNTLGYIIANKESLVVHDEHKPIKLEPGIYKAVQQREFLGNEKLKRYVAKRVRD